MNTIINVTDYVLSWKSKGLSNETIKPPTTSDNSLRPTISYYAAKIRVKFTGSCLKQDKVIFNHRKVVNIYIVYKLGASGSNNSDPTIKYCLFGAVTLTKKTQILINMGILVIELDLIEDQPFHFQVVDLVKMYKFWGLDMSSSTQIIRKKTY